MSPAFDPFEVPAEFVPGIEPGQAQFIEQNFSEFLDRGNRAHWLKQIHRWLFIERKPVSIVRQKLASAMRRARVAAITSGKGGVGKTTTSVNLAVALAQLGWRVLLFDADLGMANVHVFAGVAPRETLLDVLEHRTTLKGAITPGPAGISVLCGASGIHWLADLNSASLEIICRDLRDAAEEYDILLLDTGAGISSQVLHFLGMADEIVVVATPNLAATLDAYGVVKAIHEANLNGKVHLLINQVSDAQEAATVSARIEDCARRFLGAPPASLGHLKRDHAVELANQARRPISLHDATSENTARFVEMATRLFGAPPSRSAGLTESTVSQHPPANYSSAVA